jgi:hypothetical protein
MQGRWRPLAATTQGCDSLTGTITSAGAMDAASRSHFMQHHRRAACSDTIDGACHLQVGDPDLAAAVVPQKPSSKPPTAHV